MPSFHFLCTAEPTPRYRRMVQLWAWSIRQRAGALAAAPITVTYNDAPDPEAVRFLEALKVRVETRPRLSTAHREVNKYNSLWAEGLDQADWIVLMDCDTVVINDLAPLPGLLEQVDLAAAPEGHDPRMPPPGRPRGYRAIRGYERLLLSETGMTPDQLAGYRHPWFTGHWPCTDYPYFNGGVIILSSSRLMEFRDRILDTSRRLFRRMRHVHPNPAYFLQRFWNSRWDRTPWADRLCIGSFFRQRYADQVALAVAAIAGRFPYRVLPHAWNWRSTGMQHGEESPIRILHYFEPALGLDTNRIIDSDWIDAYRASDNPGQQALSTIVSEFLRSTGPDVHP